MKNKVSDGKQLTFTAPSGGVVSGTAYKIGSVIVVAAISADAGAQFTGEAQGVFTLPKATGAAWTEGEKLYWDDTAKDFTGTSTSNTACGYAAAAALSADTTGNVLLKPIA